TTATGITATGRRINLPTESGSTIRSIAAARLTPIAKQPTSLEAALAETPWLRARIAPARIKASARESVTAALREGGSRARPAIVIATMQVDDNRLESPTVAPGETVMVVAATRRERTAVEVLVIAEEREEETAWVIAAFPVAAALEIPAP